MTVAAKPIALTSPGPVAEAFMRSRAFIVVIIGPVGSGKTMAMLQKGVRNGAMQGARIDERGIKRRRAKFGVIRESTLVSMRTRYRHGSISRQKSMGISAPRHRTATNSSVCCGAMRLASRPTCSTWKSNFARSAIRV